MRKQVIFPFIAQYECFRQTKKVRTEQKEHYRITKDSQTMLKLLSYVGKKNYY